LILRRRKPKWDAQPTQSIGVVLASDGRADFSSQTVATAVALESKSPVRGVCVLTIAKVHGFTLGIPHPGLLPTKAEALERTNWVERAIETIKKSGVAADGQVATTRHAVKMIAQVAQQRNASYVVVDGSKAKGLRRMIEGDIGLELKRRLRKTHIEVVIVPQ